MERIPKWIYTPEFRAEAVKLVGAEGLSIDRAAKRLSVPKSSLSNWVRAARAGKLAEVGKGHIGWPANRNLNWRAHARSWLK